MLTVWTWENRLSLRTGKFSKWFNNFPLRNPSIVVMALRSPADKGKSRFNPMYSQIICQGTLFWDIKTINEFRTVFRRNISLKSSDPMKFPFKQITKLRQGERSDLISRRKNLKEISHSQARAFPTSLTTK